MLNADFLDLVSVSHFGVTAPVKTYRVAGDAQTFLKVDRHPNAFKMIPIIGSRKGAPIWIKRHLVSK